MAKIGARGHATFGGRLAPDAQGFPASAMAKKNSGDWRNAQHVRDWVHDISPELRASAATSAA
jgi:menaquinone-dependent protoporphyrinogen oxidase